jgi:hypothetical protein
MDDKKVKFIPFHAINEFMLDDYRKAVIHDVFANLEKIPTDGRNSLMGAVRKYINIPGFRNSASAPALIKAKNAVTPFERNPEFTAQILNCWASVHVSLAEQVYAVLQSKGWEVLPVDANRTKLPGFLTTWPEGQNYDTLGDAFKAMYPDQQVDENDLRLMAVWISGCLPLDSSDVESERSE